MKLCLFDLDGTLIDSQYSLTSPLGEMREAVRTFQSRGDYVGIHSDSPLETLLSWGKLLGMRGPTIAENGALVHWPEMALDQATTDAWPDLDRYGFVQRLRSAFPETYVTVGDVNGLSKQPIESYTSSTTAILVNGLRKVSLSMFVRGESPGLCDRLAEFLESEVPPGFELLCNPGFNFYNIRPLRASKTLGVRYLCSKKGGLKIVMVGNSMNDLIAPPPQILQVAVANAESDYQDRCQLVSVQDHTRGCIEILNRLSEGVTESEW